MYPGQTDFFLNQYEEAVKRPFVYLLIDLKTTQAPLLVVSGIVLRTYTGEEVRPKRSCSVNVCYDGVEYSLPLLVVGGKGPLC